MDIALDLRLPPDCLPRARRRRCDTGFTYLGLLILVAIVGIASATALQVGSVLQRRDAEEELLYIGAEFRNALISYANATPVGQKPTPASLQDLLKDPRYPNPRRHLRKLYADPITGAEEWGLVQWENEAGIIGVYSLSQAKPIKVGNFEPEFQDFTDKTSYGDWRFISVPQANRAALPLDGLNRRQRRENQSLPGSVDAGDGKLP